MADLSNRKQQNQAFLQELEKQRLNKDCNRIIDLRGKVAGECQRYEFGGRQHYLDDRAYLLVKQLMARFDGRYTIGVYETVLKALKLLAQQETSPKAQRDTPLLLRLDSALQRSEERITFSTPIKLRLDDVLYNGHTVDIASQAIRIAFKRTHSLHADDIVRIEFTDFPHPDNEALFTAATYQIIKIDHDERYTTVVLSLAQQDDVFDEVLQTWLTAHGAQGQVDVDDRLINLQSQFYQRIWLSHLHQPLLWLASKNEAQPLLAVHMLPTAQALYDADFYPQFLQKLPLMQVSAGERDVIAVIDADGSYSCPLSQNKSLKKLINWHLANPDTRLLWLQASKVNFSDEAIKSELETISHLDGDDADKLATTLQATRHRVSLLDISHCFTNASNNDQPINKSQLSNLQSLKLFYNDDLPAPSSLQQHIERSCSRFYIRTPITVQPDNQSWQVETLDVSAQGMSLYLPADTEISVNQRISADFLRWQTLTNKVNLQAIPYQVKNKQVWNGKLKLGLQRIRANCPESLNQFFDWVIAENQNKLKTDHDDVIKAAEGRLFSSQLTPTLTTVPVFLGMQQQSQREISLVGMTDSNAAAAVDSHFWNALSHELLSLSDMLKALPQEQNMLITTLYSYQNAQQQWTIAFEQDFNNSRDKTVWMQRALTTQSLLAYHCVLHPLSGNEANLESDIANQLLQWRQQRAHKVQQLRQQFSSLFGLLELTDISPIIKLFYQAD